MFKVRFSNVAFVICYSILNTSFTFGLVYIINMALSYPGAFLKDYTGFVFVLLVIYAYLINVFFQKRINAYSVKVLYNSEIQVFRKILHAPLKFVEKYGAQRFYTVMEDIRSFSAFPSVVTQTINSVLILLLGITYLFFLSAAAAAMTLGLVMLMAMAYFLIAKMAEKKIQALKDHNEDYYRYVIDLISGFKDFKVSAGKRRGIMRDFLEPNRTRAEGYDFQVNNVFLSMNIFSQYGLYLLIGFVLFIIPASGLLAKNDVTAFVIVLLFIAGPINSIIGMQNLYSRLITAEKRIRSFILDFDNGELEQVSDSISSTVFDSLEFNNVTFSYGSDKSTSFEMGPINLQITAGETIFVVGGNGSGKSTFVNVLTGLYVPTGGEISLNGVSGPGQAEKVQDIMAAIFTENHIGSHDYEIYDEAQMKTFGQYAKFLKMDALLAPDTDTFSRQSYSKGETKRISMIYALLHDKPILVLDEWAADQDPHFRKYFYETILPLLKEQKKTIIAVTHDDAYFHYADRILRFDYGNIIENDK